MYCMNCKNFFGEPNTSDMEPDTGAYRTSCPYCGSDDIEESGVCKCCSDPVREGEDFCEDCLDELSCRLDDVEEDMHIERETLYDMLEVLMER